MGMKGLTVAFLGQCNISRKHHSGYDAAESDGDLKYRACPNQTSFVSQINPKASNIK